MTLTGGPPRNIDVGEITGSEWKLNGSQINSPRMTIAVSNDMSVLTVSEVILADAGK